MIDFKTFKQEIKQGAHKSHSCVKGYKEMMSAESFTEMLDVMKNNWDFVYNGEFYHLFCQRFAAWFEGHEDEFHAAEVYFNEDTDHGTVFISSPARVVKVSGRAKAFVLKASDADCKDHAEIHCRAVGSVVRLYDSSFGYIDEGTCEARDYSHCTCKDTVTCYAHSVVFVDSGRCYDLGHEQITAVGKSTVFTDHPYKVTLQDESVTKPNPMLD